MTTDERLETKEMLPYKRFFLWLFEEGFHCEKWVESAPLKDIVKWAKADSEN